MDLIKIGNGIRTLRNKKNLTQQQLADKLMVTEKAISRWETGRGTPDISLLIPLSEVLEVSITELLTGRVIKNNQKIEKTVIDYTLERKKGRFNLPFKLTILLYVLSILLFLFYLKLEYNNLFDFNYFLRLLFIILASSFVVIGSTIFINQYIDRKLDKEKLVYFTQCWLFIYYAIFIFNMVIFSRTIKYTSYNLIPFKTITDIMIGNYSNYYQIINLLGNLIIYMPFAYFFPRIFFKNNRKKSYIILFTLIILVIELSQYLFHYGTFDIDDIILNVSGYFLAYLVFRKKKL